ncbi:respiratory nitrate reductase subunit alpha [Klebsiella pneumoniae]|nr:respiratory nitrate reductase subunit alpha [Klebsiella pneumoniae]
MLKYLLGTENGIQGKDLGKQGGVKPEEVEWRDNGLDGKLDLVVTLDFRLSSTCLYSDIVLPTATWYEKDDMNTSDMHPFIHPLSAAVDPAWESKSDWEIYKGIAKKFSEVCVGHLGKETDVVTLPIQHDSAAEMAQPLDVKDWKKGECDLIPGKTAPHIIPVERDYPATYERFTSIGPLLETIGNGGKGIAWNTQSEMDLLRKLNYTKAEGPAKGQPKLETAIRRRGNDPHPGPGNQRSGGGESVASAERDHRSRAYAPRAEQRRREDPLPRYSGAAAEDYLQPDLVWPGR